MGLGTDKSLSNFVCSCSDVKSQRRCQYLTNTFRGMGMLGLLTEPIWWLCNQISQNNENRNSLRASSPFKGYQENSCANGTQKEMQEQGVGKESESLSFPLSFRALPLTHAFTCHSKWRVCFQFITFLCRVWARIWALGDNLSLWLKFWGTFSFLGGQKFVHPSADAKGLSNFAGFLGTNWRKNRPISREFSGQTSPKSNR